MAVESVETGQAETGWKRPRGTPSLAEVFGSIKTRPSGSFWRKLVAFLGPGYLVAVGYMDPGNWATSLAGGSKFGYALLFIALMSNIMAILLQALCARLGIGAGRDLAQACRDAYPRWASWPLWLVSEIAICATDLAEVIGTAIGLNLLFGIPLEIGVIITALDVFLILWLQNLGFRWIEALIVTLLGVIAVCFAIQIALANPEWGAVIRGFAPTTEYRHQPGHALSRDRHHRRDRDAAQSVPAFRRGADAALRRERRGEARGDQARDRRLHRGADVRAADQRLDPDPGGGDLQQDRADRRLGARRGAQADRAAARLRHGADAVCDRAVVLRPELDGHGDARGSDRDGGLSRHPPAALGAAAADARDRHHSGGRGDHLVRRSRHREAVDPQSGDPRPLAAVRDRAAGDVHRQPRQDGRTGRAALAHRGRRRDRRDPDRAQYQAVVRFDSDDARA